MLMALIKLFQLELHFLPRGLDHCLFKGVFRNTAKANNIE